MTHLDTGFLIQALVPASRAAKRMHQLLERGEALAMSSVAWTEFLCGPVARDALDRIGGLLREITPFTSVDSDTAAHLFNLAGRRRGTLADCMIAAVAIRDGASLATTNPQDFARFQTSLSLVVP